MLTGLQRDAEANEHRVNSLKRRLKRNRIYTYKDLCEVPTLVSSS